MTVLVVGGAYQGKTAFIKQTFGFKEEDIWAGESFDFDRLKFYPAVNHLQSAIKKKFLLGEIPSDWTEEVLVQLKGKVICCDDISCGIVPLDPKEREWREMTGRFLCQLAKMADLVVRVQCGIPQVLKGELSAVPCAESGLLTFCFIRHAKTQGNLERRYIGATDEILCQDGLMELQRGVKANWYPNCDVLYASPMKRTLQTAEQIYPNDPVRIVSDLRERDFGAFEGKKYEELKTNTSYQQFIDSGGKTGIIDGEDYDQYIARTQSAFLQIVKEAVQEKKRRISVVCHGGTIMTLLSCYSKETKSIYDYQLPNCDGYLAEFDLKRMQFVTSQRLSESVRSGL